MKNFLARLEASLPPRLPIESVTADDIEAMINVTGTPGGRDARYRKVRTFFNYCYKARILETNPMRDVRAPGAPRRSPRYLRRAQFDHALTFADPFDSALMRFAVSTGLRRGELANIYYSDIDPVDGYLFVVPHGDFRIKSGAERTIPLFPPAREAYYERLRTGDTSPYLFGGMRADTMTDHVTAIMKAAGFPDITLHKLRHTFASWLRMDGVPLDYIQAWGGWSSYEMALRYAHLTPKEMHLNVTTFG